MRCAIFIFQLLDNVIIDFLLMFVDEWYKILIAEWYD